MEKLSAKTLRDRIVELQNKLEEANDTIEAIRTGQVDAIVVSENNVPALYTLKSADHSYRLFIEKMAEGAVTLSSDGLIVYSNTQFASLVDCPLEHVIGKVFIDFVSADDKQDFQSLFERGWQHNVKSDLFICCGDVKVPVQLSMNSLQVDGVTSLNIIVTDLTAQTMQQRELEEKNDQLETMNEALSKSNNDLQQFASVASHDLQEPLRKIQVYSTFLKDKEYDALPPPSQAHLGKILSSAARMKTLIVDILTYSRLSANDTSFESTDLGNLFQELIDDFDLVIAEKNAVIELGKLPVVEVNKGQLRQVFTNLISNGLKFSRAGVPPRISICEKPVSAKEMRISLGNDQAYCRISVQDNGIGFDEKFAASIFNLFEKLNPKSSFEGSGIGLAIAKKIIDKHHGMIIARSKEGHGSEFNIILPYLSTIRH